MIDEGDDGNNEMDTNNAFDNLTILKELDEISNVVKEQDFLETIPKDKFKKVKWIPLFNCLKRGILDEMVQELNEMWVYENMTEKIAQLEKQKEKFTDTDKTMWRPQLGDVKAQLRAHDAAILLKQKKSLESVAREYEVRVNRLKKTISAKRCYIKALQQDISKYQKKSDECIMKINNKLENHTNVASAIKRKYNVEDICWTGDVESDLDN